MIQVNIFQAPKGVDEEGRGLNVCSDPQIAGGAIVNRRQENAPAFAFGGDLSFGPISLAKCDVNKSADGQLSCQGEDA